ncbi:MAG: hypothetical protein E7231_05685 [Cellulosilyticum sp.]|nr:hypothetical protein [Cellulosilyticum sp.]
MAKEERVKYSYQYDSTARAYAQPAEPIRVPVPQEPKRKSKGALRPKVDVAFGTQMVVCGVVLFACSMIYVHNYSSLRAKQTQLNNLKIEKINVASQITSVEAQMTKKLDLDYIRERAAAELGMQNPLPYQIVYIDLEEKSYTTYNESK